MVWTRLRVAVLIAALICGGQASGSERTYDEIAWREYREAKRQQVAELCEIWFPTYRPSTVGKTYVNLAGRVGGLDVSKCGPLIREHFDKSDIRNTEIAEIYATSGLPNLSELLRLTHGASLNDSTAFNERELRILELIREQAESEKLIVSYLKTTD
jgi:hypothetical protein